LGVERDVKIEPAAGRVEVQGKLCGPVAPVVAAVVEGGRANLLLLVVKDPVLPRLESIGDPGGETRNTKEKRKEQCGDQASWHLVPLRSME
jgi:hypothetical protein